MDTYTVRVSKDYLGFAAAHFIVFDNDQCERLHGHNYRVAAEIEDVLQADHLVFDFIELKRILKTITDELDHRMLIPVESETLDIEVGERRVRIRPRIRDEDDPEKEWIIPRCDCALLPIANSTAELIAKWFSHRLRERLLEARGYVPKVLRIDIDESPGQRARYETRAE